MTPNDALRLIHQLCAAFPQATIGADTMAEYGREIQTLNLEPAHETVRIIVRSEDWFPPIAQILRTYREVIAAKQADRAIARSAGRCQACDGNGWRYVDDESNTVARCGCSIPDQAA